MTEPTMAPNPRMIPVFCTMYRWHDRDPLAPETHKPNDDLFDKCLHPEIRSLTLKTDILASSVVRPQLQQLPASVSCRTARKYEEYCGLQARFYTAKPPRRSTQ
jgi:hypothetical protein